MSDAAKIGKRIQTFRAKLDMSVDDLSARTSLPVSLIEDIEGGSVSPALGVMVKLSRALGQRVGTFMDDQIAKDPVITRSAEREEGVATHKGKAQGHYRYHALGAGKADRHMEPFFIKISPTESERNPPMKVRSLSWSSPVRLNCNMVTTPMCWEKVTRCTIILLSPTVLSAVGGDAQIYAVIFTL